METKLKQQAKASYGNRNVNVTYNSENELERKIACMKVFNQTPEEYDEQSKRFEEESKKYSDIGNIDCSYRGAFIEGNYSERHDFVGSIVKDLSFLDICFNCDTEMVDQKAIDNAWDLLDYNSGGPYCYDEDDEDDKWKAINDAYMEEEEKRVQKLKEDGKLVTIYNRAHEIVKTTLESHCPNCGNVGTITMNLEPVIITDYGIQENRASTPFGKGAMVYNKKEDRVWPQIDLFQELEENEELITRGHPLHEQMVEKLENQQQAMFNEAMMKAAEKFKNT